MSTVQYADVYIINPVVRSISGRHTITEEDLGLPTGTLPPEDVASLGSLITVTREHLRPFNTIRTATKRLCESKGVRVGMGTAVPAAEFSSIMEELKAKKDAFYQEKAKFLSRFRDHLEDRVNSHPQYAHLIKASAPSQDYIDRRMHYDIDVYMLTVPSDDPNSHALSDTLSRAGNDIGHRLLRETAEFTVSAYQRTMKDSRTVVRRNLSPFRESLLPKLRSFQLLDSRCRPVADFLEQMLNEAEAELAAVPRGDDRSLSGPAFDRFMDKLEVLQSVDQLEKLAASSRGNSMGTSVPVANPPPQAEVTPVTRLPKRPMAPVPVVPTTGRKAVTF